MKKLIILFLIILTGINFLSSSQSKPSRVLVIENCNKQNKTTLTLIDSDGDNRYDKAIEKFCDNSEIQLPIVIQTKLQNDPVPEEGDIAVDVTECKHASHSTCEKLKIAQGIVSKNDMSDEIEISFKLTFFDLGNNVTAVARQTCDKDTLFITGAMCNVKWNDEDN